MFQRLIRKFSQMKMASRSWVPRWFWLAAGLLIGVIAVALAARPARPAQITLWMRPVHPLTLAACAEEAHQFGYSLGADRDICGPGAGGAWYRAAGLPYEAGPGEAAFYGPGHTGRCPL
jgi:hypothetical protein